MNNTPQIRFPEFTDSYVRLPLGDIATRVTRKNKNNETDIPLTISSIDGLVDQRTYFSKVIASKDMSGYYLLKNGEFAYNKSYSAGFDYGSIKRLDKYSEGALSTLYICFKLNGKVDSDYLTYYFDSQKWTKEVSMICAEGARNHGLLNVPTDQFFDILIDIPRSVKEQKKIAAFFKALDELIDATRIELKNAEERKRGLVQQLFSGAVRFKAPDGSEYPQWQEHKLKDILHEYNEKATKGEEYEHVSLTKEGVVPKTERYNRDYLVTQDDKKYRITHLNDICYNPANLKFGVICRNKYKDAIFSPIYVTFKVKKGFDPGFIEAAVTRPDFINYALKYQEGTVYERMAVSSEDLLQISIPVPCLDEQIRITECLTKMDEVITAKKELLESRESLKAGFLNKMFMR